MGTWPDTTGSNTTIGVVGPLVDTGGIALELLAFNYPGSSPTADAGASYYFPFQVNDYWSALSIVLTQAASSFSTSFTIQVALYAEIGDTSAKQISIAPIWETLGQVSSTNTHTLSPQPVLPPGGYYIGFQTNGNNASLCYNNSTYFSPVFGCRFSASPFQSIVTDLSRSIFGILSNIQVRATLF